MRGDGYSGSGPGRTIYYHLNFGWGWGGYWYNTPADLIKEGDNYTGFVGAVYNIYTNQDYSAETVIASGRVTRNGRAAAGVRVSAAATDDLKTEVASATTDEKGIYALFVPAGEYKVKNLVEVRATLEDGDWVKPSDGEIDFKNGKVIVTPNKGGATGFARVKIPAS